MSILIEFIYQFPVNNYASCSGNHLLVSYRLLLWSWLNSTIHIVMFEIRGRFLHGRRWLHLSGNEIRDLSISVGFLISILRGGISLCFNNLVNIPKPLLCLDRTSFWYLKDSAFLEHFSPRKMQWSAHLPYPYSFCQIPNNDSSNSSSFSPTQPFICWKLHTPLYTLPYQQHIIALRFVGHFHLSLIFFLFLGV